MRSMVVLCMVVGAVVGSLAPAQPPHLPALFLDPHGRPLEPAEVINARALHLQAKALEYSPLVHAPLAHGYLASPLLAHSALAGHYLKKRSLGYLAVPVSTNYIGGSAVTHQSRVDVASSPAVVAHSVVAPVVASPVISAYSSWPAYGAHLLKKRSLYAAPILTHAAPIAVAHAIPSAVSHQSRVDVHSSPAIVSHSVVAPVVSHSVLASPYLSYSSLPIYGGHYLKKRSLGYLFTPQTNYVGGSALTHESRVDVHSAPAIVSHSVIAPVVSVYGGHLLKKRSVALGYGLPAVSHQARVDVVSSPALTYSSPALTYSTPILTHSAPIVAHASPYAVAHAIPAAVSHQARFDVISPVARSAVWTAPHLALSAW